MSERDAWQPNTEANVALLQHALPGGGSEWLLFRRPRAWLAAATLADVRPLLRAVEDHTRHGGWAAGFVTYEAAPAFDPAFVVQPLPSGAPVELPLAGFGLYDAPVVLPALPAVERWQFGMQPQWTPSMSRAEYDAALARLHEEIAAGNTYQVNLTLRLGNGFTGRPADLFGALVRAQPTPYAAFIHLGHQHIAGASPELFFHRRGDAITMRPMKGTAPLGRTQSETEAHIAALQRSEKDRAENLMIVDMVRNDLSRIARRASVRVPRLFDVERYPTVLQMTSTVEARTSASLEQTFAALFPCASITGAPKISAMRLIRELETTPRGIYTGAVGFVAPHGEAQFNVAIRTLYLNEAAASARYGTGGGIVWDSDTAAEYAECALKAAVLAVAFADFQLIETLLFTPARGIVLLERHLDRLCASAAALHFPADRAALERRLHDEAARLPAGCHILRLLLHADGRSTFESRPYEPRRRVLQLALAREPVSSADPFLRHKTTRRDVYDAARAAHPAADDVLLMNERGELTEATVANLVLRKNGVLLTPPLACGLLPGTYRAEQLARGRIREGVITIADLRAADAVFLINSVRGWQVAELIN